MVTIYDTAEANWEDIVSESKGKPKVKLKKGAAFYFSYRKDRPED